ncbi:amino acid adenylation domain-containing protein, partial [Lysinibacillus xylanilyticus]|uniref:non-ribosomal peptide synthetase n=1 Tax=Lysinibacillus xylanilyticus TaxID=582475 RepID=UPI002B24DB7C
QQYLNRPQLTEEKFVMHPNEAIGRIYRTGDKGVWQENGEINFLGRMDNQVKIRGYRVELGEIERAFEKVRDVSEVVVHVHDDDLVAFYEADVQIEKQVIITTLSEKLPHYMIPTEIHFFKELPRLSSGKIDRKSLLALYSSLSISTKQLTENMSRTEQIVREYWTDILHVQPSSNSEHFFENGGHSLKGSVLLAKLSKRFNVDLTLDDLYQNPTIKELAYKIEQLEPGCHQEITPYPIQDRYPISLLQKQLFVIHQMDLTSIAYNVPILVGLKGSLDVQKTTRIMQQLVKRHEVFRTSFHLKEGELYQEICPSISLDLTVEEGTAETIHHIMRSFVQPFQLEAGSLLRIKLVACNEQEWYLCLDSHHIIVDGISMRIFFQEFIAIYNGQALPEKMIDYKDYTLWCLEESQQNLIKNNTLYWQSKFGNDVPLLNFPTDYERPRIQTFNGATLSSQLSNDETNKVHKLAKKYQVSTSLVFLSCYNILLHKYTKQQDLVVGVPISGRMRPEVEHTIGMFVHTLPIQSKLLIHQPFNTYLQNLKDQFYEDYKHQMFDFEELINSVHVIKDSSRNPLFDTVLTVHHNELEELVLNDFSYTIETFEQQMSKFDFSMDIEEVKGKTELILRYNTDLFAQETMETFLSSFHYLIEQIVASPEEPIHKYSLLNEQHITNLMVEVNNTARSYQNDRPIYRLIEEQVVKTPHYTAVVCGEEKITYEEFNQKANALATRLREKGYGKGDFIPVIMNRSIEMPLVMFAISKIGAAFCPMDPSWPIKRIETIIRDLNASILLTNTIIPSNQLNIETMFIEHVQLPLVSENLKVSLKNDHIMCVIYTSGSTGVPKGVKVLNRGILNRFNWMNDEFREYAAQSVLNTTNYVYDSALWQLFWPMINGGKTVIPLPEESLTAEYITQIIEQENITLTDFVPSVFDVIVQQLKEHFQYQKGLRSLQTIILGGEALTPSTVLDFLAIFPHVKPYNLYGPTEASIGCIYHQITGKEMGKIPIGRPIANTKIYLLDEQLHIVPKGVTGEIYISGICLAEGYLHDEEKTATAFIENPYAEQGYEKLYKTGDLAKILPNGEIDFLGRIDSQVKIRGLRIELQEIERQLLLHSFIKEAVVQAVTMVQQTHLCAYITSNEEVDVHVLRKKLEEILPYYMVPTYFIQIDSIPIANSGKVDKKALPLPTIQKHKRSQNISPSNELEVAIYDIWKKIIVTDDFGVHDNFFELGGDSIKALQLISHLKSIHLKCTLQQVFLNPTIAELSKVVKQEETKVIAQKPIVGEVLLTPIQRRFFTVQDPHLHFNQAILLESKETINLTVLQQVLDKLITHHDALRLQFKWTSSAIHQENLPIGEGFYSIEQVDLQDVTALATQLQQEASRIQQSISLTTGPLMKVAVMKAKEGDFILFAIHHLVVDGVSWRILMEDFIHLYDQAMQGRLLTLPEKTVSYQEWAEALQAYSTSKKLWKEARYWQEQESTIVPALPKDKDIPLDTCAEMGTVSMQLDSEWTARLLREAPKAYQTEINDLLLAALGLAMNKWSGNDSIRVDLEGHGREELDQAYDLSRTVGWFTSIYPVVLDFTKGDLSYYIRSVKETLRKVPNKGIGYGVFKYGMAEKPQWMRSADAEISFNYLGQIDIPQADELSGFSLSQQSLDGYRSKKADNLYTLDINSQIVQGRLVFKVDYASEQYEESTMHSFISLVKSSLQEIISHCISVDRTTLTPSDVGATALTLEELKLIEEQVHGVIKKVYPLSPMQEGMLFHHVMNSKARSYFEQNRLRIHGTIDEEIFRKSCQYLLDRYDIFKTAFIYNRLRQPMQVVLDKRQGEVHYRDISHLSTFAQQAEIEELLAADKTRGFDLENEVLLRAYIIKLGEDAYEVIWSEHHILMDGWCLAIVMKEFMAIYSAFARGQSPILEDVVPYEVFIHWLSEQDQEEAKSYWKEKLNGFTTPLVVSHSTANNNQPEYIQETVKLILSKSLTGELEAIAKQYGVTVNTIFQSIWGIFLRKLNQTDDILFGTVVSGRTADIAKIETMVGLFINTIPLRLTINKELSFKDLVQKVQHEILEAEEYSYYPLASMQSETSLGNALINHIVVFENHPLQMEMQQLKDNSSLPFQIQEVEAFEQTNYDFNVVVLPNEAFEINFVFNANVYSKEDVEQIRTSLHLLIESVTTCQDTLVRDLNIVSNEQYEQMYSLLNDTEATFPIEETILSLFETQVKLHPSAIAIVEGEQQLTYSDLNAKANQVARFMTQAHVQPQEIVGILLDSSIDMVISILATLKCGAIYLPIDPTYPKERITYMMEDSQQKVVLTKESYSSSCAANVNILLVHDLAINQQSKENFGCILNSSDVAYIIYTSGTTGQPKGVEVTHRNVVRLLFNSSMQFDFSNKDVWTVFHSFCFDFSVWEMYGALLYGGKLIVIPKQIARDTEAFHQLLINEKVTVLNQTPTAFLNLSRIEMEQASAKLSLRYIIFGGEALKPIILKKWAMRYSNTKFINMYGITETTVHVTYKEIGLEEIEKNESNIGKPIPTLRVYILDQDMQPVPVGVPGELYVAGEGVTKGYLNRQELTNDRFISRSMPISTNKHRIERLYRSGDIVKVLPNGELSYIGRRDEQVKIRGHRIETNEIILTLLNHPEVEEAVVAAIQLQNNQLSLVVYYVSSSGTDIQDLRDYLKQRLPFYMLPNYFMRLDALPLTSNGKVDKSTLPNPIEHMQLSHSLEKPVDEKASKLVMICEEVLGIPSIGLEDNYFALGGDSIKALQIYSRLRQHHLKLEIKDIFENPAIKDMSRKIKEETYVICREVVKGEVPLTPIQRRFFTVQDPHLHFNQAILLESKETINLSVLQQVLDKLITHHDALRLQFKWTSSEIHQENLPIGEGFYSIEQVDLQDVTALATQLQQEASRIQQSISLTTGPLMKVAVMKAREGDFILFAIHHLVVDGVSWRILMEDFIHLYDQAMRGRSLTLPEKTVSYQEWAEALQAYSTSKKLWKEARYWQEQESTIVPALPKDKDIPLGTYAEMGTVSMQLDSEWTARLLREAPKAYQTEINDLLLAALGLAMNKWSGNDSIRVDLEGHGREELDQAYDLSRTVGWFTSIYPVVLDFTKGDLSYYIRSVKETLRKVPNKGLGYGVFKYGMAEKPQWMRSADAEISFNYLGQTDLPSTESKWEMSTYPLGEVGSKKLERLYAIDISGKVINSQLTITIDYSQPRYNEETMTQLLTYYQESLLEILNCCIDESRPRRTPSDIGNLALSLETFDALEQKIEGSIVQISNMTPMQQGMLYHAKLDPSSHAYFEQASLQLVGHVQFDKLEACYRLLINKYETFRTLFITEQVDLPCQVIVQEVEDTIRFIDLQHLQADLQQEALHQLLLDDRNAFFDFKKAPLTRMMLVQLNENRYQLIWSFHHMVLDGWSMGIVMKEFFEMYEKALREESLPSSISSNVLYIDWLNEQDPKEAQEFWQEYLDEFDTLSILPYEKSAPSSVFEGKECVFTFGKERTNHLKALAETAAVTLNSVIQAGWGVLLQKYNATQDVVFGSVVSGRPPTIEQVEQLVGLFINTIPVRVKGSEKITFNELVQQIQKSFLYAEPYYYYPLYEIQTQQMNGNPLIHHVIAFENYPVDKGIQEISDQKALGFEVEEVKMFEQINYAFGIVVIPSVDDMTIKFTYNGGVFTDQAIANIREHFIYILDQVIQKVDLPLNSIELLSLNEQSQRIDEQKEKSIAPLQTVLSQFEEQVSQTPNHVAIKTGEYLLTYEALHAQADQIRTGLQRQGITPGMRVGVMMGRAPEVAVALFGIWKAGAVYVPLDGTLPAERLRFIIEDADIAVILTKE